jgi:hypothetical protein
MPVDYTKTAISRIWNSQNCTAKVAEIAKEIKSNSFASFAFFAVNGLLAAFLTHAFSIHAAGSTLQAA